MIRGASLAEAAAGLFPGTRVFISTSPAETIRLGEQLGRLLAPGSVVALRGALGAGKTWFTKGIARALGITEAVTSPTYTILSEYRGRDAAGSALPLYHFDAWRLSGDGDFAGLGAEEYLYGRGIAVIEWSDRVAASLPETAVTVEIDGIAGETRRVSITAPALPGLAYLA
jgi:tRNA threonylcarbamoyladenosine biosynthesis protein TsaE